MKVNLNVPFMNYKGLVITKKVEGTDVEQEQLMKDVIAPILFSGEWRDERVNALSGDEKIRAYSLSLKIAGYVMVLTDAQLQEIAKRVRAILRAESKGVGDLPVATSLDGLL